MRELAERASHALCLALGRLLRAARYSRTRIVVADGECHVRKERLFYAAPLIQLSGPLVDLLDTGVRVLRRRDWQDRELRVYQSLYGLTARADPDGTLILPCLPGETLAALLERAELDELLRRKAVELAAVALAELHRNGLTHGDAMADNVLVDLDAGVARWFDFETAHDARRSMQWRRADDVRALLATCLLRTTPERFAETIDCVLVAYRENDISDLVASSVSTSLRRPLVFHLGQAPLSFRRFRDMHRLLLERRLRARGSHTAP